MLELEYESKIIKKLLVIKEICSWLPPGLDGRKVCTSFWHWVVRARDFLTCQKNEIFTYPICIWRRCCGSPHLNFTKTFGVRKRPFLFFLPVAKGCTGCIFQYLITLGDFEIFASDRRCSILIGMWDPQNWKFYLVSSYEAPRGRIPCAIC